MRTNKFHQSIFVLLFLLLMLACLSGCSLFAKKMEKTPVQLSPTPTATKTTIPASPIETFTPTPNLTATEKWRSFYEKTPQPDTTPTPDSAYGLPFVHSLGKGIINGVYLSPDGKTLYSVINGQLLMHDSTTLQETGATLLSIDPRGDMYISKDGKLAALPAIFGAEIIDLANKTSLGIVRTDSFSGVSHFVFSPDDSYVVFWKESWTSGGPYQLISIFDLSSGKVAEDEEAHDFPFRYDNEQYLISAPVISPNSRWVAAGSSDNRVYLWNAKDGSIDKTLEGHGATVTCVDFSPDGRLIASGSDDGTARLWDPTTGNLVRTITGLMDSVQNVAFSPDGKRLMVTVKGHPAQAWDVNVQQLVPDTETELSPTPDPLTLKLHQQGYADDAPIDLVQYSPDGRMLAVASRHVQLWDATSLTLIHVLEGKDRTIRGLAFSADVGTLAAVDRGGNILVWNTRTGQLTQAFLSEIEPGDTALFVTSSSPSVGLSTAIGGNALAENGLGFSPDGAELAFANGSSIEVWNVAEGKKLLSLPIRALGSVATNVAFSPDGKRLYAVLNRNRSIQVWDPTTGQLVRQIDTPALDPNAFTAITLQGDQFAKTDCENKACWIELWDLKSGASKKLPAASEKNEPLRFSPDGRLLVAANDSRLYFWDTDAGKLLYVSEQQDLRSLDYHDLSGISISPDGKAIALSYGVVTELLDISRITALIGATNIPPAAIPTLEEQRHDLPTPAPEPTQATTPLPPEAAHAPTLPEGAISPQNAAQMVEASHFGQGTIERINWSPDGKQIAVAGSQGVFRYDAGTLKEIDHLDAGPSSWAYQGDFLPDGSLLSALVSTTPAATDGSTASRVIVVDETGGQTIAEVDGTGQPAISPDGKRLVFTNRDGDLVTWDIASNRQIAVLHSYLGAAHYPLFSPDGQLVAGIDQGGYKMGDFARVWDAETGAIVNALTGPDSEITDLSFSPDGQCLVGAAGGAAWIWHTDPNHTPEQIRLFEPEIKENSIRYQNTVTAAAIDPSDRILAIGTSDHQLLLYDRQSKRLIRKLAGHTNAVARVQFSPDGVRLASSDQDGNLIVWNVATGSRVTALRSVYTGILQGLTSLGGSNFTVWSGNTVWTVRPGDGKLIQSTTIAAGKILSASSDGKWLGVYDPFQMYLYDAHTGQKVITLEGEAQEKYANPTWFRDIVRQFYAAAFSADGRYMAAVGTGGVWVYETHDGRLVRQEEGNNGHFVALSPDGQDVLTCGYFPCPGDPPKTIYIYSPDGRWKGSVGMGWKKPAVLFIDGPNGHKELAFSLEHQLVSLAFSPNGTVVAVGQDDGRVFLVDTDTLQIVKELPAHQGGVISLAFSKDGRYLASAGQDGVVRIWLIQR